MLGKKKGEEKKEKEEEFLFLTPGAREQLNFF